MMPRLRIDFTALCRSMNAAASTPTACRYTAEICAFNVYSLGRLCLAGYNKEGRPVRALQLSLVFVCTLSWSAAAQPAQPTPTRSTPVEDVLAASPQLTISNGLITARIAPPDLKRGFYRGTRFDQAGTVTSLVYKGREFYGPWFDRTGPDVLDYAYDAQGRVVGGQDSATSGPVEEFAPLGFEGKPGTFIKIGVGVLRQPDSQPYDHYRHYSIVDGGKRGSVTTRDSVTFTQNLSSGGVAYMYQKTLRLTPGKPELVIEHVLKNAGVTPISTTVYDHNFLKIKQGNDAVRASFPFIIAAASPPPTDMIRIEGKTLTYLRSIKNKERISFLVTGFSNEARDYDFTVEDTASGAGVRVLGDQPITRLNIFSIDKVQSVEPYIAINLAPGEEKRWAYNYQFKVP